MGTSAKEQFISLRKAAEICPYSQEYLSLRARQGKLQAIKRGRNWSTTKVWVQEYVVKSDDYKSLVEKKQYDPPLGLPVYAPEADVWEYGTMAEIAERAAFWRKFQFALATVALVALFGVSITQEKDAVIHVANEISPVVISTSTGLLAVTERIGVVVGEEVLAAGIGELVQEYTDWVSEQFRSAGWRVAGWFTFSEKEELVSQPVRQSDKKGLVVIPSAREDEKVKEQVQQSFSDEVVVIPYDEESGIITPVFRERKGEDYLYILVPLKDAE